MTVRTLLIDGDLVVYRFASAAETPTDWGDGTWTLHADLDPAIEAANEYILGLEEKLEAQNTIICLSDPKHNFRKGVLPTYKENRKDLRKPVIWQPLRDHIVDAYRTFERPGLEADDIMGILATHPTLVKGEKVIVTEDKDLLQIPALVYRQGTLLAPITPEDGDFFHMMQTLTGDQVDGYSGCPGIGPVKAEAILNQEVTCYEGKDYVSDLWRFVVEAYAKVGLTEEDALVQARVARILRASDYDFKKKEPILWTP